MEKRKWVLYVVWGLFILALGALGYRLIVAKQKADTKNANISIWDVFDKSNEIMNETKEKMDEIEEETVSCPYDGSIEAYAGKTSGSLFVDSVMTNIITRNKKYENCKISVVFDGEDLGTDTDAIQNKKENLPDSGTEYDISFEYENGKIITCIIKSL